MCRFDDRHREAACVRSELLGVTGGELCRGVAGMCGLKSACFDHFRGLIGRFRLAETRLSPGQPVRSEICVLGSVLSCVDRVVLVRSKEPWNFVVILTVFVPVVCLK